MSRNDHKIETSLEGIEHLSKAKKEINQRIVIEDKNNDYCLVDTWLIGF